MSDLRINARWLISMANGQAVIEENRAVFITNGRICAIENQSSSKQAKQTVNLWGKI